MDIKKAALELTMHYIISEYIIPYVLFFHISEFLNISNVSTGTAKN